MLSCRALCRHRERVRGYQAARQAQLDAAEAATLGYRTEWQEFTRQHPLITFKEWLIGTAAPAELPDYDAREDAA